MKYFLILTLFFVQGKSWAQVDYTEQILAYTQEQLTKHTHSKADGIYGFYQRVISDQLINDCLYEESCSLFSKNCFKKYGILRGALLTSDRLTRCNRVSMSSILPVRLSKNGKIKESSDEYTFRSK